MIYFQTEAFDNFVPFILYIKQILTVFLFEAQLKLEALGDVKAMDYALSFASGIVMVLTSPWAHNFNCAPQSRQYLYTMIKTWL